MSLDLQDKEKWEQMMCWLTNIQPKVKQKAVYTRQLC